MSHARRSATLAVAAALVAVTPLVAVAAQPGTAPPAAEQWRGERQGQRQGQSLEVGPPTAFSRSPLGDSLVIDHRGDATIVWTRSVSHPDVLASHRPAGGDWGDRVVLGRGFDARVEADRRGRVTAAWSTPRHALVSARSRPDGSWGPSARLTPPAEPGGAGRLRGLDLAVARGGRAMVAWSATTGDPGSPRQVFWARRPRGAGWAIPPPATRPGHPETPSSLWPSTASRR